MPVTLFNISLFEFALIDVVNRIYKGTNCKMDWGRRSLVSVVTLALVLEVHRLLPRLASLQRRRDNSRLSRVGQSRFLMTSQDCLSRSLRTS